jgi:hypothetical protein
VPLVMPHRLWNVFDALQVAKNSTGTFVGTGLKCDRTEFLYHGE